MYINKREIIPYSLAIGMFNVIFTGIIIILASIIYGFPITFKIFTKYYTIGYIVLWLMNIDVIEIRRK